MTRLNRKSNGFNCPRVAAGATAVAIACSLAACGGGGGGFDGPPAPASNQAVGGIWSSTYTLADGSPINALVLTAEDGRSFGLMRNLRSDCVVMSHGNLAASGGSLTGSFRFAVMTYSTNSGINTRCSYADGSTFGASAVTGTVAQRSALTMSWSGQTSKGLQLPA